jgi:CheY-like chemotaxis protein
MSDASKPNEVNKDTVIVAEDSDPNRQILCLLLRKLGFAVLEFRDGALAWQALQDCLANGTPVCAVISDLMMPNMDGLQFLRHVRNEERTATLPFVLVTAVSDKDYVFEAKSLSVDGYILKPVTYKRVADKMQALFPQRQFPQIAS